MNGATPGCPAGQMLPQRLGRIATGPDELCIAAGRETRTLWMHLAPLRLISSAVGLFGLTYALIAGNTYGWSSARILASIAVGVAALVIFVLLEMHQRVPMLDLSLFKNSTFTGANLTRLLVALAMFGVFFFNSLFLGQILHYSPIQTGAAFLPMTVLIVSVAPLAGRFSDKIGSRWLMARGSCCERVVDLVLDARCGLDLLTPSWSDPRRLRAVARDDATTAAAMGSVPVDKAGVGSAVLNSMRQVAGRSGSP